MALRVWLPLNGTLENKGIMQITSTNNINSTINSNGKIGSCYTFNGSNLRIEFVHDKNIWIDKEISIAMWYKYSEGNTTCTMVDIAADLCLSYTYSSSTVRFNYWRAYSNNGTRTGDSGSGNYYDATKWHHVVLTCDHNINKIYVDGTLDITFDRSNKYTTNWKPLLASSYNKITLGKSAGSSPYGSGYLNDVRIYDHCLSAAEVKEISQGLVLHYKLDDITNGIKDSSGYENHAISNGSINVILNSDTSKYSYSIQFLAGARIATPVSASTFMPKDKITVSIWYKSTDATKRFLSCTENGGFNFEVNSSKASFPFYIKGKGYGRVVSTTNFSSDNQWHMITATYDGTTAKIYRDGILDNSATITSGWENIEIFYNTSAPFTLGAEAQTLASPMTGTYVGNLSDCRIYATALSAEDIKSLYNTSMKIDNLLNIHTFEFIEDNPSIKLTRQGQLKILRMEEEFYSKIRFDNTLYTEPDGSTWIHIFHHNNPANARFNNGNTDWSEGKFLDADRWYDIEKYLNHNYLYEFLYKLKTTSSATETKYRWILTTNPLTSTWTDVKPGTCSYNTSEGYTNSNFGGMYLRKGTDLHMCIANGNSGNWYGGLGACNAYNGGIPGYPNTTVTSGYIDLYIRVYIDAKLIKNVGINANTLIER